MISRRQIISRSTGPIFAIFTSNESFLAVDDRSGPLFSISQGTLPWQPILCKKKKTPHYSSLWHSETVRDITTSMDALTAELMPVYCWKFCEIRSSNSRVDRAHLRTSGMTWPKNGPIWSNIHRSTGPIFANFTPYERALRADDGTVALFQFIKGCCHVNQILLQKCVNVDWYHLHSAH